MSFSRIFQNAYAGSARLALQAFFDESGGKGTGRWMTMVGLFAPAEVFAVVANEWDRSLRAKHPGSIRYFKMEEAMSLSGEFAHWREEARDEQLAQMARVIDRPDLLEVPAVISLKDFASAEAQWAHVGRRHSLNQPYLALFQYVMVSCVSEAVDHGATRPIEIVFDDNDLFRPEIQRMYPILREVESEDPQRFAVLPVQPWFRDDKDFVVLQASDLLAGQLRLFIEAPDSDSPNSMVDLCPHLRVSKYFKQLDMKETSALIELERDQILRDYPED